MPRFLQIILLPLSWVYKFITQVRNYLYDRGYFTSIAFRVPTIQVGNLTVGGSGKTPHVEYLIRLLQDEYHVATLSRGYKRKTRGYRLAQPHHQAKDIGDEPMQFYRKYGERVAVSVGEDRVEAIPHLLMDRPDVNCIVLDDAYQHRALKPGFNVLLCNHERPFFQDYPFPAGRLRESRWGAQRAHVLIVSKCPEEMPEGQKKAFREAINRYTQPGTPILFSGIRYGELMFFRGKSPEKSSPNRIVLLSGIANARSFFNYAQSRFEVVEHLEFSDHHDYTPKDMERLRERFSRGRPAIDFVLCTEKDMVKLRETTWDGVLEGLPMAYLPIEVYFLEQEERFQTMVKEYLSSANQEEANN